MKDREPHPTEAEIQAWIDDRLAPEARQRVDDWLAAHPEEAEAVLRMQQADRRLREHFSGLEDDPLPEHWHWLLEQPPRRRWLGRAAVVLLPLIGFLFGWALRGNPGLPQGDALQDALLAPAAFAHGIYATDRQRPVELGAESCRKLARWVSDRMHADIVPPDLSAAGLAFIGGRLLPSTDRMAVLFLYEDAQGRRYSLYIRRQGRGWTGIGPRPAQRVEGTVRVAFWQRGEFAFALVGSDGAALQRIARLLQAGRAGACNLRQARLEQGGMSLRRLPAGAGAQAGLRIRSSRQG